jgi:putative ABC transport system substrate-binding protein
MRRRDFILLGSAIAWPLVAQAQVSPKRRPLIAWLSGGTIEVVGPFVWDRLPALAEEIVRLKPDVILAAAVSAAVPARKVTSAIPIVCPALADAVHLGLIVSEARPGGNVTGIEPYVAGLPAKQMELVREIAPGAH